MGNKNKYSCLIIGLGQIGMGYDYSLNDNYIYTHAKAFSSNSHFNLVGAIELDSQKRKLFESKYDKPSYQSVEEAGSSISPDLVVIASPTDQHLSVIKQVLSVWQPVAILCEKPLAYSVSDAEEIVSLCKENSIKLFVNYIRRTSPGAIEVKKRIDKKEILTPIKGVVWYSKGFIHNGSHFFNLLEYWIGGYKDSVIIDKGRFLNNRDAEPHILCEFENGSVSFIPVWEEYFSHYCIELLSENGRILWERDCLTWRGIEADKRLPGYRRLSEKPESIPTNMDQYQKFTVEHLDLAIKNQATSICSASDALESLKQMHKVLEKL